MILSYRLKRKLELDPDGRNRIHRFFVFDRGTKPNTRRGFCGAFIQSVSQAVEHAQYAGWARSRKQHFQRNFSFNLKAARLIGIDGTWLLEDFEGGRATVGGFRADRGSEGHGGNGPKLRLFYGRLG